MAHGEPLFRALGPLEVRVDGVPVDLGPTKQRALLAVLLALAPDAVPVERLVDELWPDGGPGQPMRSLQVYVSALRRALGSEGRRLTTVGRAYRLEVPDGGFDVAVFEEQATTSREQHRSGDHEAAVATADAALTLWRGQAWQDLRTSRCSSPTRRGSRSCGSTSGRSGRPRCSRWDVTATRCPSWRVWCACTRSERTCAAT